MLPICQLLSWDCQTAAIWLYSTADYRSHKPTTTSCQYVGNKRLRHNDIRLQRHTLIYTSTLGEYVLQFGCGELLQAWWDLKLAPVESLFNLIKYNCIFEGISTLGYQGSLLTSHQLRLSWDLFSGSFARFCNRSKSMIVFKSTDDLLNAGNFSSCSGVTVSGVWNLRVCVSANFLSERWAWWQGLGPTSSQLKILY